MVFQGNKYKNVLIGLAGILILIQFIHPDRNESGDTTYDITRKYPVSDSVKQVLKTSCYDCHSNTTKYPWYYNIQPVAWWLAHHVNEGKDELNFSEFGSYPIGRQYHKLEEITRVLKEGEMPISSYTLIHGYAKLNDAQLKLLTGWANSLRDSIGATYPADSLVRPRRKEH